MKILFFSQYFWPENFRINEIASYFSKKKKSYVLTGYPSYPNKNLFKNFSKQKSYANLKIIRVPVYLRRQSNISIILNYLSFILSSLLFGILKIYKKNFDIIFIFCPSPILSALPAIFIKKILKKKSVLWVLDLWPNTLIDLKIINNRFVIKILRLLIKFIYDNNDLILAQSQSICSEIQKITKTKCIYFPSWPEEDVEYKSNAYAKEINNNDKKKMKILFTGNIGEAQSFETLIKSAKLLKGKKIVKWIVVGDGRWKNKFIKLIKKEKLENDIQLINSVSIKRIGSFFNQADGLYLSLKNNKTFKKTIPGKLQTYMNTKKPIIASISGETKKIIENAKCGFVSNAEDYKGLKKNIIKLYNLNLNEKKKLGKNGKKYSNKYFNKKKILKNLDNQIKQVLKEK